MEISPILLAKMLMVSFLFAIQAGRVFDVGRAARLFFSCDPKSAKLKKAYRVRLPFSKREMSTIAQKKTNRFLKNAVIFFADVIFVIYSAWGIVKINYSYNDGELRAFSILGFLMGFVIYYFTFSRVAIFLLELVIFSIKYFLAAFFDGLYLPFLKIYNNLVKNIKKVGEKFHFRIEKKGKKVYNVCEVVCKNESQENKRIKVRISTCQKEEEGCGKNEEK